MLPSSDLFMVDCFPLKHLMIYLVCYVKVFDVFSGLKKGLYHPLGGIANPKIKLVHFLTTIFFAKRKRQ